MSDKPTDAQPSDVEPKKDSHTEGGAPTDKAHEDAGDGSLAGSVPAGLTTSELQDRANSGMTDGGGTG